MRQASTSSARAAAAAGCRDGKDQAGQTKDSYQSLVAASTSDSYHLLCWSPAVAGVAAQPSMALSHVCSDQLSPPKVRRVAEPNLFRLYIHNNCFK